MSTIKSSAAPVGWSLVISLLVLVASLAGLFTGDPYAQETANWTLQARGQDVGNLLAVVVLLGAAVRLRAGSLRAGMIWLGALLYLIYAYLVYAMAVHLNALFLAYVAVLGLSSYAVIFAATPLQACRAELPDGAPRRLAAWTLLATGALFGLLWLSELVPALLTGQVPASLAEAGLLVNPIHVIDLSVVLPGFILTGVAALRGRRFGLFWLGPWLAFSVLMGSSIVAAMLLMAASGVSGTLPATVVVGLLVAVSAVALWRYLRGTDATIPGDRPALHAVR